MRRGGVSSAELRQRRRLTPSAAEADIGIATPGRAKGRPGERSGSVFTFFPKEREARVVEWFVFVVREP